MATMRVGGRMSSPEIRDQGTRLKRLTSTTPVPITDSFTLGVT